MNITGISLWGDSIGKGVMYDAQRGRYAELFEIQSHYYEREAFAHEI